MRPNDAERNGVESVQLKLAQQIANSAVQVEPEGIVAYALNNLGAVLVDSEAPAEAKTQ